MKPYLLLLAVLLLVILIGCTQSADNYPGWINHLISSYEKQPVGNPPQSIWQYQYQGQTVYFIPAQCCDQFSMLYDAAGKTICAPDGGFSGQGDGKCPDFFQASGNKKLIWKDSRTP
jgi:hypothetical protein